MKEAVLERLWCAVCRGPLRWQDFAQEVTGDLQEGVVWCTACRSWYPIEGGLLELLPLALAYIDDRHRFWQAHRDRLQALGFTANTGEADRSAVEAQRKQQEHFDWYASNDQQTYDAYEQEPFQQVRSAPVYDGWRRQVEPGKWLLDIGCAQGCSTFEFMELPIHVVGVDISKALIRQALARYRRKPYAADASFFVGDASRLPFRDQSVDYVLIYGVLHHLPDPAQTCQEVARVLRKGGLYFGSENNPTVFRPIFDLLQKIRPVWHEEAGAHSLISAKQMRQWFAGTPMRLDFTTNIFVPPHLVNLLGTRWGGRLLRFTDGVGRILPFVRNNGGLLNIRGQST